MSWRGLNWDGDPALMTVPTPAVPDQPRPGHGQYTYIVVSEGRYAGLYMPPLPGHNGDAERIMEILAGAAHTRNIPLSPCAAGSEEWTRALGLVIVGLGQRKFI